MEILQIVVIAVLLSYVGPAAATPWKFITESAEGSVKFYADPKVLVRHGQMRHLWLLYDYQSVQQDPDTLAYSKSETVLMSVNCSKHALGPIRGIEYSEAMARGAIVQKKLPMRDVIYQTVVPGTTNEKVLNFACKLKTKTAMRRAS